MLPSPLNPGNSTRHESLGARAIRAADRATDPAQIAALLKTAGAAFQRATALLQDVGLLARNLGTLNVADSEKAEKIPSGLELQRLFESVVVQDSELVSEAERAMNYGDWEAARDATDSVRERPNDHRIR